MVEIQMLMKVRVTCCDFTGESCLCYKDIVTSFTGTLVASRCLGVCTMCATFLKMCHKTLKSVQERLKGVCVRG